VGFTRVKLGIATCNEFRTIVHLANAVQQCLTLQVYGTLAFKLYGTLLLAIVSVAKSGA
jgi:hypothetical protein